MLEILQGKRFCYGTDWTQAMPEYRDVVLASIVKDVASDVFEIIQQLEQGDFISGTTYHGIADGKVSLSDLSASFTAANPDLAEEIPEDLEILQNQLLEEGWLDQWIESLDGQ